MADVRVWIGYEVASDPQLFGMWELDPNTIPSLTVVDGTGSTDDSVSLTVALPYRWIRDPLFLGTPDQVTLLRAARIVVVGIEGRIFGPYDIESVGGSGATATAQNITIVGRVDRLFEETVLGVKIGKDPVKPPWDTVLAYDPFKTWQREVPIPTTVFADNAAANTLATIRATLETWALTCHPRIRGLRMVEATGVRGSPNRLFLAFERDVEYLTEYPTDFSPHILYPTYTLDEYGLLIGVRQSLFEQAVDVSQEDISIVRGVDWGIPDLDNDRGKYKTRSIVITTRSIAAGTHTPFRAGTRRPHIYLPSDVVGNSGLAQVLLDRERWKLQNGAATATIKVLGGSRLSPRHVVTLPRQAIWGEQWRVVSATHQVAPGTGLTTDLALALWQGEWVVGDRVLYKRGQ